MTDGLTSLLEHNSEIQQYYSALPENVKNAVAYYSEDICSLDDLLKCIRGITGNYQD